MTELQSIADKASTIRSTFDRDLKATEQCPEPKQVERLRVAYLGRKGHLQELIQELKHVSKNDRPSAGKTVNDLRSFIETSLTDLSGKAQAWQIEQALRRPAKDVSLPTSHMQPKGSLHPVTLMRRELLRVFRSLGFSVYDGPEIDAEFYNFSALNFQDNHPARDMQDTFFIDWPEPYVLRTHTSNIQIHAMLAESPPLRIVAPGRTYRCDSDLTHTPMFHQIEGFVVDKNISFADLKGVIDQFLKFVFGADLRTRFRPSYFPFVEPGAEVDLECVGCHGKGCRICSETGWLEVGGLGMIHPNVFESVEYDSEDYTGFAFGFGIDRLAMLKYGLPDLRQFFDADQRFLHQFPAQI